MGSLFPVEISLLDEEQLARTMENMRTWLDHKKFDATTFRYSFVRPGIVLRIDFPAEPEARAFAEAFGGKVAAAS